MNLSLSNQLISFVKGLCALKIKFQFPQLTATLHFSYITACYLGRFLIPRSEMYQGP